MKVGETARIIALPHHGSSGTELTGGVRDQEVPGSCLDWACVRVVCMLFLSVCLSCAGNIHERQSDGQGPW